MASVSENLELVLPTNEDVVNIGDISENFRKIDDTLGVNADDILELSTLIAALQSANQALTQRINTEILGPLNDLIDDVDAFDSQIQSLSSRMSTAEGTISSNTSNITQNTNDIAQLRFDMDDAETAITEHNHDSRYILLTAKGTANGVAELDSSGKVLANQLPSYVDDVLEYSSQSSFPVSGEDGKIYVAKDVNKTYRQTGSAYVEVGGGGVALGETSSTAYRGDRGKVAYNHATDANRLTTATSSGLYKVAATANGHIQSLTAVTKADITALGIPGSNTTYESKSAVAGGTQESLVTTGEKYTWNNKAASNHTHDDRYYTETEVNNMLTLKSDTTHNHDSKYLNLKSNIGVTYSDYNSYKATGIYIDDGQGNYSHRPDPDNALPGVLEVMAYGDYCHQMFKCFTSNDVYIRYLEANNTWSEWDGLSGGSSYPDGNGVSY